MKVFPLPILRGWPLAAAALLLAATAGCQDDYPVPDYAAIAAQEEAAFQAYITTNKLTNAQRQASGLYLVPDSVNATLPLVAPGSTVSVRYTGQLLNGQVFDATSRNGNKPFTFVLGANQVIQGWEQGFALLHKGDKARLLIPSALGYGGQPVGTIPAFSPLVFAVQVVDVK